MSIKSDPRLAAAMAPLLSMIRSQSKPGHGVLAACRPQRSAARASPSSSRTSRRVCRFNSLLCVFCASAAGVILCLLFLFRYRRKKEEGKKSEIDPPRPLPPPRYTVHQCRCQSIAPFCVFQVWWKAQRKRWNGPHKRSELSRKKKSEQIYIYKPTEYNETGTACPSFPFVSIFLSSSLSCAHFCSSPFSIISCPLSFNIVFASYEIRYVCL